MFYIIDTQAISNVRQCPVCGIEEHICTCVILRSYPFPDFITFLRHYIAQIENQAVTSK